MRTIDLITPHSWQVAGLRRSLDAPAASLDDCGSVVDASTYSSGPASCRDDAVPPGLLTYETAIERTIANVADPANRQIAMTLIHTCNRSGSSTRIRNSRSFDVRCLEAHSRAPNSAVTKRAHTEA